MARVKICHTQATHRDRSLLSMDSGGNAERSTRKTAGFEVLATVFFATAFFLAIAFLADFTARVAMLQVYQNWSLPYANHMAMAGKGQPRRVQYRVGLGATVSLLVAGAIALVAWASLANTHTAIVELTNAQVRDLLTRLDARVQDHLQGAV